MLTIPVPKDWDSLSELEKERRRAFAYPDVLDDKGREWRMGMITDLQAENARLRQRIAELETGKCLV